MAAIVADPVAFVPESPEAEPSDIAGGTKRKFRAQEDIEEVLEAETMAWAVLGMNLANDLRDELKKVSVVDMPPRISELKEEGTVAGAQILDWNAMKLFAELLRDVVLDWTESEKEPWKGVFKKCGEQYGKRLNASKGVMLEIMDGVDGMDGKGGSAETRKVLEREVNCEDIRDVATHWSDLAKCMIPLEERLELFEAPAKLARTMSSV